MRFMRRQFWNSEATEDSFRQLGLLQKEVDFVLIGGWAVYLYVEAQKNQDIDIVIDTNQLNYFRKFGISDYENSRIKHSEIGRTVVDLFIEEYMDKDMPFPTKVILNNYVRIGNIKVVEKNLLLLLKLWRYFSADEIKHRKDVVDVVSLLFYGGIDLKKVKKYATMYKIERRKSSDAMLEYLDVGSTLAEFITDDVEDYEKLKYTVKSKIKKTFD